MPVVWVWLTFLPSRRRELMGRANPLGFMYEPPPGYVKDEDKQKVCGALRLGDVPSQCGGRPLAPVLGAWRIVLSDFRLSSP